MTINVNWTSSWVAEKFLPESVAPHIAIAFPLIFIGNAFWLLPKYFNKRGWPYYLVILIGSITLFELIRAFIFSLLIALQSPFILKFTSEFLGDNSLIFGPLNVMILNAFFWSFVYRFFWDWWINHERVFKLKKENQILQSKISESHIISNRLTKHSMQETFLIKKSKSVFILKTVNVVCFQAQGDFIVAIDDDNRRHIINTSLKNIKSKLNENSFFQINRSEIVNINFIKEYTPHIKNRLKISTILPGKTFYSSNRRTPEFRKWVSSTN
ncbi:LytR/AlgR family response regulator transcription factor [Croceitalea rosinachiae]|uniref:LytTR family DNA-binding domain-containing protein n=1 Tax=Croceitalea rosinachiae TaxID=3075596 RepID=A0ABU3A7S3_9FLAO|nr:LytTR family DNA-binding domain-containing protein [Croceitalea sp. F388]MDT0605940.1 LytTR family DNA-binding domain-containing protein [Croceitalea sp. F388]